MAYTGGYHQPGATPFAYPPYGLPQVVPPTGSPYSVPPPNAAMQGINTNNETPMNTNCAFFL